VGRFNGDDCLFAGDRHFFDVWQSVTSAYGFEVNVEKTGFSSRWGELNSRVYDYQRHRFVGKPVLSFLRPEERSAPGCILSDVLSGVSSFRLSTQKWVVCEMMRWEISLREICLATIPRGWLSFLLKRRWFRDAVSRPPPDILESGVNRSVPVKIGPPPREPYRKMVERCTTILTDRCVSHWIGRRVRPFKRRLDRRSPRFSPQIRSPFYYHLVRRWSYVWPASLLSFFERTHPECLLSDSECLEEWMDDSPLLHVVAALETCRPRHGQKTFFSVPSQFRSEFPLGYS
jgi:hypothetical protein